MPLTANEQSLSGSIDTINRMRAAQADLPLDHGRILVLPIISRFERRVEYELAERWLAKFAQKLAPFYQEWLHRDVKIEEILNFTRIPSVPFWNFGEELPVIEKGTEDPDDIGFSLETVAALVAQKFASTDVLVQNRDSFVLTVSTRNSLQKEFEESIYSSAEYFRQTQAINLFISYAREDVQLKEELEKHLTPLLRQKIIQIWSDSQIPLGENQEQAVNALLEAADIILLLISVDYLASPSSDMEAMRSLERLREKEVMVLPILLRSVYWEASSLSNLQVLPSNTKPVMNWPYRDEAWVDVVRGIYTAIKSLKKV